MTEEHQTASVSEIVDRLLRAEADLFHALGRGSFPSGRLFADWLYHSSGQKDDSASREFVDFSLKNLKLEIEAFIEKKLRQQMLWFFVTMGGMLSVAVAVIGLLIRRA